MTEIQAITDFVKSAGPIGLIALALWAYRAKWWYTGREYDQLVERLKLTEAREAKWETLALRGTQLAGTATTVAQQATQTAATALAQAGQMPPPAAGS